MQNKMQQGACAVPACRCVQMQNKQQQDAQYIYPQLTRSMYQLKWHAPWQRQGRTRENLTANLLARATSPRVWLEEVRVLQSELVISLMDRPLM